MPFDFARRWLVALVVAALALTSVAAFVSLPRAYLLLATTTSTRDTGLLPYLLPEFTADTGIEVRYVAVGTGQALDAGRRGDADAVIVHAPDLEDAFLAAGDGLCRNRVMYNRFVVVGPVSDPANVRGAASPTDAFLRIYNASARFASRADGSGTHIRELEIWAAAGLHPSGFGPWYEKTGQGMGQTLTIANERDAYTLSDAGTWYAREPTVPHLDLLYDRDEAALRNRYSVIPVNPAKHPGVRGAEGLAFARWLVGSRAQGLIDRFAVNGHPVFVPDAAAGCP